DFTPDALKEVASIAIKQKTGARGLRAIMETKMLDIMYEIPELGNVKECLVSKDVILGEKDPVYVFEDSNEVTA
nr:ATP-dependent Clp protease ATP-binding subunit ClpX [Candidatus Cloacimonadota bacterium]